MPIYNGTQLVSPGVDKVYNGSSLVYTAAPVQKVVAVATRPNGYFTGAAVEQCNGKIYIFGGSDTQYYTGNPLTDAQVFDPSDNTLTALTSLPQARLSASAVLTPIGLSGELYIAILNGVAKYGGYQQTTSYVYQVSSDTYTTYNTSRALGNRCLYYSATQGSIYSSGGNTTTRVDPTGDGIFEPSYINISSSGLQSETTFTNPGPSTGETGYQYTYGSAYGAQACYLNGEQYIGQGGILKIDSYSSRVPSYSVIKALTKSNGIDVLPNGNFYLELYGFAGLNGYLYIIGGRAGTSNSNKIYKYNVSTGDITDTGDTLPVTTSRLKAFTIGNSIYILTNNTIYKYTP